MRVAGWRFRSGAGVIHSTLLIVHRWLGLVTAVFIFIIALTGSALVFESDIDRVQHPELWTATPSGPVMSLDSLAQRASAAAGSDVTGLTLPTTPGRAVVASVTRSQVYLDPVTGAVLGQRSNAVFNESLPRRLHRLHVSLLVQNGGSTVVALMTIAALLLTITGIIVWWEEKRWRVQWRASWKRVWFDLHHSLGVAASLVLLIVSASGLVIHYDGLARFIRSADTAPAPRSASQPPAAGAVGTIGFDSVAHIARAALPEAQLVLISRPGAADQPIRASMRFPDDRTPGGRSRVTIDRYRGTVLALESTRAAGRGSRVTNVMRSVHTGDVYGAPTRAVWFLCALVLAWQALSGAAMWWNMRGARAALARRAGVPASASPGR